MLKRVASGLMLLCLAPHVLAVVALTMVVIAINAAYVSAVACRRWWQGAIMQPAASSGRRIVTDLGYLRVAARN